MSRQTYFRFILVLTIVAAVVGGQLAFSISRPEGGAPVRQALAGDGTALYLPVVLGQNPLQSIFGTDMGAMTDARGLDDLEQNGTSWLRRVDLQWREIEPGQGARDWSVLSELEQELINATNAGMSVVLVIRSTPDWAQKISGSICGPVKSSKFGAFASFMHDLVARYSKPPYNVQYYEIWNEPDAPNKQGDDLWGCWGDPGDFYFGGEHYGNMLEVVHPQIKAANPHAQVVLGGQLLDCDPTDTVYLGCSVNPYGDKPGRFFEGILKAGAGNAFDGVSFHAYDFYGGDLGKYANLTFGSAYNSTGPVTAAKAQYIKEKLADYGVTGKFLMNTESGVLCDSNCDATFETTKAYYVPQAFAMAIAEGLRANFWYSLYGWRNSGLFYSNGSPRPAYDAYVFARQELGGAQYVQDITGYNGVMGYELDRKDKIIWVIWSLDGNSHSITLPSTPDAIWDAMGDAETVNGTALTVTLKPLYVEWNP